MLEARSYTLYEKPSQNQCKPWHHEGPYRKNSASEWIKLPSIMINYYLIY